MHGFFVGRRCPSDERSRCGSFRLVTIAKVPPGSFSRLSVVPRGRSWRCRSAFSARAPEPVQAIRLSYLTRTVPISAISQLFDAAIHLF